MPNFKFLLLLLPILFVGCQVGGSSSFIQGDTPEQNNATYTGEPVTGDWVVMNLLDEPETLNPFTSSSASATNIYSYIYETFLETRREPPWDNVPLLVESMPETSEDHLTYSWTLRQDITWHDGKPLTVHDAVFTLKAIMNPYVDDLPTKPYYAELDSIQLSGERTLKMFCSQPYFMHEDFLGGFQVLPEHIFDPEGVLKSFSYYQVRVSSAYGGIADAIEKKEATDWDDLYPAIALKRLEKGIESATNEKISWDDLTALPNWKELSPKDKLTSASEFLKNHTDGAEGLTIIESSLKGTRMAVAAITEPYNTLNELGVVCRRMNGVIKKFGEEFNQHPQGRAPTVGSGPYKFESWTTGKEFVLKRNENYWRGEGHAYLDKIVWRVLTDYTASLVALKNGEIDFMERMQPIQYLTMTNQKKFLEKFVKDTYLVPSYSYLGWRYGNPLFSDKRVRRAMTHMVRRKEIAEKMLFGFAEVVTSNFYRYGMDYDSTIVAYEFDPIEAQRLLAEAGWADIDNDGILEKDSLEFRFEMLLPNGSQTAENLASILREDLFMIGVEMDIRRLEWSVFINNYIRNHTFDACYLGWVFGMKGDPKQVWHSESATGRGSNHVEFKSSDADSLIDAARVEFDQEKRVAMYHRFQQILHEEQPYTFLFSDTRKPAYDKRFKGVRWYPLRPGYQFDEWFVPKDEQKFVD